MNNPLLITWDTPHNTPPFNLIDTSHYRPAAEEAIKTALEEVDRISGNEEIPTFENTIEALEKCGEKLGRLSAVLYNLNNAETSKELQTAAQEVSPLIARFSNDITLNEKLFSRVKTLYESLGSLGLNTEQTMLLEKKYREFRLGGAALEEGSKARFRVISEELSLLTLKFEENVLYETNAFILHLTDPTDLKGLPPDLVEMASSKAGDLGKEGWVFTLDFPSYVPFMQYSDRRDLREKMLKAYSSRAFHGDERDNRSLLVKIVTLRLEAAKLLGFESYAGMVLGDRMAEDPGQVLSFLDELYEFSYPAALRDFNQLKEFAESNGHTGNIERWDWAYWSEKLKKSKYQIDDEILRPYFSLGSVREAIFGLATRLYGLKFEAVDTISVYNDEVKTWEVSESSGELLAILYLDFHPRKGKSGGAWMTSFRDQKRSDGKRIIPQISLVTNFTRPSANKPSLLSFNELTTFLHEFGHALHGMLSDCNYESLSGTNVARDFVELPSQFMENWAFENEWLNTWASHYETGEMIPGDVIDKIREASTFNEGYACNRQLGFGFLDMAWHSLKEQFIEDISIFEESATSRTELFPKIKDTSLSCSFTHLFGGGYAAGYYGYKWAEVLDADAFRFFTESGLFSKEVASSFRRNILERGGTEKPMNLYIRFRGKKPSLEAFLERSGLK